MRGVRTVAVTAVAAMALAAPSSWAQPKKLVFWTHWEQNPEFNKFYETRDDWLAAMKKLTVLDAKGEPTQVGFALRHKGHPVGITDKFLPFAHAFGARMLSPNLEKATGFANSAEMVAALQFYSDLVNKH